MRGYGSQAHSQNNGSLVGITSTAHSSGAFGQVQGDSTRKVEGALGVVSIGSSVDLEFVNPSKSIFVTNFIYRNSWSTYGNGAGNNTFRMNIDNARVVPTSNENRPVNMAVRYLIRARP